MKKTDDPCRMCEGWGVEAECEDKENCPVEALKRENKALKKKVQELENAASWDWEIKHSHPDRDFW